MNYLTHIKQAKVSVYTTFSKVYECDFMVAQHTAWSHPPLPSQLHARENLLRQTSFLSSTLEPWVGMLYLSRYVSLAFICMTYYSSPNNIEGSYLTLNRTNNFPGFEHVAGFNFSISNIQ